MLQVTRGSGVFGRLAALPQPVIAVIAGDALGGGLELAMAADLRLAARSARFGCPEVTIGVIPGWMGTRRLAELIGPARARHLLLLGSPISATQAYDWGLVTAIAGDAVELERQLVVLGALGLEDVLRGGPCLRDSNIGVESRLGARLLRRRLRFFGGDPSELEDQRFERGALMRVRERRFECRQAQIHGTAQRVQTQLHRVRQVRIRCVD